VKHGISPDDAWGFTFLDRSACRKVIENSDHGEIYTPPSTRGTVLVPAPSGGHNWGGGAYDSGRNLLITPVSQVGFVVRILPLDQVDPADDDHPMAGMPFGPPGSVNGTGYALQQRPFLSPMFSPCTAPPWAKLVAVDMTEGVIRWEVPLGVLDKLMPVPIPLKFGTPFSGGPIVTATGLVFIGATLDERVRAFDTETGEELWQIDTPTAANATPMTYMAAGRQFVVIAAGGHMFQYRDKISDYLLAFSLPTDR
jgi:quinoprotein glucose dehydrogenase